MALLIEEALSRKAFFAVDQGKLQMSINPGTLFMGSPGRDFQLDSTDQEYFLKPFLWLLSSGHIT